MAEITVLDVLLLVLAAMFFSIALAMRRLRNKMLADLRKNIVPFMGMRHMIRHSIHEKKRRKN